MYLVTYTTLPYILKKIINGYNLLVLSSSKNVDNKKRPLKPVAHPSPWIGRRSSRSPPQSGKRWCSDTLVPRASSGAPHTLPDKARSTRPGLARSRAPRGWIGTPAPLALPGYKDRWCWEIKLPQGLFCLVDWTFQRFIWLGQKILWDIYEKVGPSTVIADSIVSTSFRTKPG